MPNIVLMGQLFPKIIIPEFSSEVMHTALNDIDLSIAARVALKPGFIQADCAVNRWNWDLTVPLYQHVLNLCRVGVSLYSFKTGHGLDFNLHLIAEVGGESHPLIFQNPALAPICTTYDLGDGFTQAFRAVAHDPLLTQAMHDLSTALQAPDTTLINCGRALERIRRLLSPNEKKVEKAWAAMRETLRIEEAYLKFVIELSKQPRHGQPHAVAGITKQEVMRRAWTVMNRYLDFIKCGGKLPDHYKLLIHLPT